MHDVRSDGDAILRLDNVNKHYRRARSGQADIIHAAKDVSFDCPYLCSIIAGGVQRITTRQRWRARGRGFSAHRVGHIIRVATQW